MPDFSKKHYEAVVGVLQASRPTSDAPREREAQWLATCRRFVDMFAVDNPRYDRARFWRALNAKPPE